MIRGIVPSDSSRDYPSERLGRSWSVQTPEMSADASLHLPVGGLFLLNGPSVSYKHASIRVEIEPLIRLGAEKKMKKKR